MSRFADNHLMTTQHNMTTRSEIITAAETEADLVCMFGGPAVLPNAAEHRIKQLGLSGRDASLFVAAYADAIVEVVRDADGMVVR